MDRDTLVNHRDFRDRRNSVGTRVLRDTCQRLDPFERFTSTTTFATTALVDRVRLEQEKRFSISGIEQAVLALALLTLDRAHTSSESHQV